jgi:hypothetical protein
MYSRMSSIKSIYERGMMIREYEDYSFKKRKERERDRWRESRNFKERNLAGSRSRLISLFLQSMKQFHTTYPLAQSFRNPHNTHW